MADPPPAPATDSDGARNRLAAIGLMLVAVSLFSALDASAKYLATREAFGMAQIVWVRFAGQFVLLLLLVPAFGVMSTRALFTTSRPGWQTVRSFLMVATTAFNFLALKYLRLDQTISIVFLAPLVVAALAGPLLGEWIGRHRAAAVVVGFLGVLIVIRPGVSEAHPAVIYSLLAMLAYALFMLLTRHIAAHDPPLVTLFYSMFAGTLFGAPLALADWVWPSHALDWLLLGSLGILGGTGHYLFIHAYRLAPASTVAPFLYLQLLTMVAFGYFVFGDVPDGWTMVGAAVIIGSGIYLIYRERIAGRAPGGDGVRPGV